MNHASFSFPAEAGPHLPTPKARKAELAWVLVTSINQSINLYRAIVQRRVIQCSYAESKRNVLRRILNVLTDGAVRQFSGSLEESSKVSEQQLRNDEQQCLLRRNWQKLLCGWSQQARLTVWADQISEVAWLLERISSQVTKFGEFEVDPLRKCSEPGHDHPSRY